MGEALVLEVRKGISESVTVEHSSEGLTGISERRQSMNKGPVVGKRCLKLPRTETEEPDKEPGDKAEAKEVGMGHMTHRIFLAP